MFKEYKYRPPLKYLVQIPLGIFGGIMFGYLGYFIDESWWFKAIMFFFSILFVGYGVLFFLRCFQNLKGNKIFIDNKKVILPFNENGNKLRFDLSEMIGIDRFETFDTEVIEIESKLGFLEIEKSWMNKNEFEELFIFLKKKINKLTN